MIKDHHQFFKQKISQISQAKKILEIGGGSKPFKEIYKNSWLEKPGCQYTTLDVNKKLKPDIVADAHKLPLKSNSFDVIICNAVLEHLYNPQKAIKEIYRVLKPKGKILVTAPFLFPYHGFGKFKDYYRFTQDGLLYLFKDFKQIELSPNSGYLEALTLLLPTPLIKILRPLAKSLDKMFKTKQRQWSAPQTFGYTLFATK